MKEIFYVVWFSVLAVSGVSAIVIGLGRSERAECFTWQDDAKTMPGYYLTAWQAQQCTYHGITINAPIK